ncbi:hypothetical protein Ocin01_15938 [Orchesella cincta]|uniref:Uncharacterized protein n=1 Tax=Orchesella cincta TaxID=48709 RepID=A0A1D2MCU9_ORCCI|nr:hypothetical protein Ocin01_15938 [Orchesella cincta]
MTGIQVVYLTVALMVLYILLDFTLITTTLINNKLLCWSCFVGSAITSLAFVGVALCLAFFGTAFLICLWVFSFKVFIIVRIHKYIEKNEENKKKLSATAYLSTPEDGSQSVYLIHQQQFGGVDTSSLRKDEVNFIHTLKKPNTYLLPSYNAVSLECEEN